MSLVDTSTGEIVEICTEQEATAITARFRDAAKQVESSVGVLVSVAIDAFARRVWIPLGYENWDKYCEAEVTVAVSHIPRELRVEIVSLMSSAGMSTRAIGSAIGVNNATVSRDRGVASATPESIPPTPIATALDDLAASVGAHFAENLDGETVLIEDATGDVVATVETTVKKTVIKGLDGKNYSQREPAPVRRKALVEASERAGWDLRRVVERLVKIREDDRFDANKGQVAAHLRGHLSYTVEVCQDLLDQLDH